MTTASEVQVTIVATLSATFERTFKLADTRHTEFGKLLESKGKKATAASTSIGAE